MFLGLLRDWLIRVCEFLFCWRIGLSFRLYVSRHDVVSDYPGGRRFRFAVVDLDRAKDYPVNFVCVLPMRVESSGEAHNIFMKVFGAESLTVAKRLLVDALEREQDFDVRGEIERRLKLLEPKSTGEAVCVSCGKLFQKKGNWFKQKFCQECLKKRFAGKQ
jgi:hypothetical protein